MDTILLKKEINKKIEIIDDDSFLNAINLILDSKTKNQKYILSDYQLNRIVEAEEDSKLGRLISDDALQLEIEQWLNMK